MQPILVTGGLGFIGSHTVVELVKAGYKPIIADDLSNSNIKILEQLTKIIGFRPEFHKVDLCDDDAVNSLLDLMPDLSGIIHFAAFKSVNESVEKPLKYYRNNFYSLINLLNAIADKPVKFVFSSSCTVYGQPYELPVTENAKIQLPESPYSNTKQVCEEILKDTVASGCKCKVVALRYFNPAGAHESALIGELPIGIPQNLIPFITQSAIGKRGKIIVHGGDYDTPDGSAMRDFIHVVDIATAHIAALKLMDGADFKTYDVFNLGTGHGNSVLEAINVFEQSTGEKLNYEIGPRRPGDIEKIWGDIHKSKNILQWTPAYDLKSMMTSAWAWEKYISQNPF